MSFRKYLDELELKDRLTMVIFNDIIEVWRAIFPMLDKFTGQQIEALVFLTHDSLKFYWGDNAQMSLEGSKLVIKNETRQLEKELSNEATNS